MAFKDSLKKLRIRNNLSQIELADKLNVKQYVISSWEIGRSEPSINQIIELANIFKIPTDYLLNKELIMVSSENEFNVFNNSHRIVCVGNGIRIVSDINSFVLNEFGIVVVDVQNT